VDFLRTLPIGAEALRTLIDSYPVTICHTRVPVSVIGVLSIDIPVDITWRVDAEYRLSPREGPQKVVLTGVLVVHRLPVPLHVSYLGTDVLRSPLASPRESCINMLDSGNFPEDYRTHPFWFSTKLF